MLAEIGAESIPEMLVFNKADLDPTAVGRVALAHPGSVAISARTGLGVDAMLTHLSDALRQHTDAVELVVPWDRGEVLAALHRHGEVLAEAPGESGMEVTVRLDAEARGRFAEFVA